MVIGLLRLEMSRRKFASILPVFLAIGGCDAVGSKKAQDPTRILGCYAAVGGPKFELSRNQLRIVGSNVAVPYAYEWAKIGMVIRAPLEPSIADGPPELTKGDEHFFRVDFVDGKPIISIAFGPHGEVLTFRRALVGRCQD